MLGDAPNSPVTGVPGWLTDAEEALIARYAAKLGNKDVFVGIGVEYGRSMAAVVNATPAKHVYGVELYPKPEYEINMKEAGYGGFTTILEGDSYAVGNDWGKGEIDLLFIDGDHTYEGAARDIQAWTPHVKLGGFVLFHDVAQPTNSSPHYLHFEVTRAITKWLGENTEFQAVEQVDSIAVFKRIEGVQVKGKQRVPAVMADELAALKAESDPTLPLIETPPTEVSPAEETQPTPAATAKNKPGRKPANKK